MKIKLFAAAILSLVIAMPGYARMHNNNTAEQCSTMKMGDGQTCGCKHGEQKKWRKALNLTDEQKKQFKAIRQEEKAQMQSLREKMHEFRVEMHKLASAKDMDETKIKTLIEEKKALVAEQMKVKLNALHKMYGTLTESQKQQFLNKFSNNKK